MSGRMTLKEEEAVWNAAIQKAADIARSNGGYQTYYEIMSLMRALSTATNKS